jgi:uncharacterized protein GlcG (DUF336 family)
MMDGAQAERSAVRMGVSTAAFLARVHRQQIAPESFCDPQLTASPGGAMVCNEGRGIGAIGVGGLTSNEGPMIANRVAAG